ncbi:MAG: tetratricopeptide repeat protein [Luteolibacter sp.]
MKAFPRLLLILGLFAVPALKADTIADLTPKAEAGDLVSQVELGNIYSKGEGVAKNEKEAVKWFSKAAEQGNLDAQMYLGGVYIRGKDIPKDSRESAKWYLMAAEQGNAAAQCQISRMHMMGAGVPKDDVEAYKWANLASAKGDMAAKKVLRILEKRMMPDQISLAQGLGREFTELKKSDAPGGDAPPVEPIPPEVLEP